MTCLQFDHVWKGYRIRKDDAPAAGNGWARLWRRLRPPSDQFWALRDVSFEVRQGEALGIIGHNGAGKSTALKLLSNITAPTLGQIRIRGRLAALLEVGSGFHPELTGRENIFLSGSILGMRRSEIARKLDDIIDFAEIRQFIDVPVKRYSSGMYVRLGFSIAAHLEPEILLLDEVLAVGDAAFQEKCIERVLGLKQAGVTIVFISHDLKAVQRLCSRALVLRRGEIVYEGDPSDAIAVYQQAGASLAAARRRAIAENKAHAESERKAEITAVRIVDAAGRPTAAFHPGDTVRLQIDYAAHLPVLNAIFAVCLLTSHHTVYCYFTTQGSRERIDLSPGTGTLEFVCENLPFQPDVYRVDVRIDEVGVSNPVDLLIECASLVVLTGPLRLEGDLLPHHTWSLNPVSARPSAIVPAGAVRNE